MVSCVFVWGTGKSFRIEQEIRMTDGKPGGRAAPARQPDSSTPMARRAFVPMEIPRRPGRPLHPDRTSTRLAALAKCDGIAQLGGPGVTDVGLPQFRGPATAAIRRVPYPRYPERVVVTPQRSHYFFALKTSRAVRVVTCQGSAGTSLRS